MALLWIDGFEGYGNTVGAYPAPSGVLNRRYPTTSNPGQFHVQEGRVGGYAMSLQGGSSNWIRTPALTTDSTLVVGFGLSLNATPGTLGKALVLYEGTTEGMQVRIGADGEFHVYRNTTLLASTSGMAPGAGTWIYLEFKVVCGNLGSYELRINGGTALSASGVDTQQGANAYHSNVQLQANTTGGWTCDDLYVLDGTGTVNNDFLGNVKVVRLNPYGTGDITQWSRYPRTELDNVDTVNDAVCDDDATYVETAASGQRDLYTTGNFGLVSGGVKGIQINTDARVTDATTYTLKTPIRSGGSDSVDAGTVLSATGYTNVRRLLELNPITGLPWTGDDLSFLQTGIQS